jgi:hypothetical protein
MGFSVSEIAELCHGGFGYAWHEGAFLSRAQARYALERLWFLVAGSAAWEGPPAIVFPAVTLEQIEFELDLPPGAMPWIPLDDVLPKDVALGLDTNSLPAIGRAHPELPVRYEGHGVFPLDLPAAVFLGLTRWEEWKRPAQDAFGCHDEEATQCARQGYRDRPVLDEWAMVVRKWIEMVHPSWRTVLSNARLWITHDIDVLWYFKDLSRVMRGLAKGAIRQRSPVRALMNFVTGLRAVRNPEKDPCYQGVQKLMDLDESLGMRGTFFFMTSGSAGVDESYDLKHPSLLALLDEVKNRGHEIGWHISLRASGCPDVFERERAWFCTFMGSDPCGVRHHYLSWRGPESWRRIAENGFVYDSSLGYNYIPGGFRCGTAHPYQVYDLQQNSVLSLIERPLIVMDGPVIRRAKERSPLIAAEYILRLFNRTILSGGCFSILIHNSVGWDYPSEVAFFQDWLTAKLTRGAG